MSKYVLILKVSNKILKIYFVILLKSDAIKILLVEYLNCQTSFYFEN